jgi:hypothetical protein
MPTNQDDLSLASEDESTNALDPAVTPQPEEVASSLRSPAEVTEELDIQVAIRVRDDGSTGGLSGNPHPTTGG